MQSYSNKSSVAPLQNRHVGQWHKIEDLNMSTYNVSCLIFNKDIKIIHYRKENAFNK